MNLASIIDDHAPDATALIFNNRATTYGDLRDAGRSLPGRPARRSGSDPATVWR